MGPYRWPAPEAVERLNRRLRFPATGREQDWEVEFCDSTRLGEWVSLFRSSSLDLEERSALALLILFSLIYPEGPVPAGQVAAVGDAIGADRPVHERMISYWVDGDMLDDEGVVASVLGHRS